MRAGRRPRRRRAGPRLALAVLVAGAIAAAAAAQEASKPGPELERLRRAIAERRENVAAYERREQGLFQAIESIDRAAHALRIEARRADREADEAEATRRTLAARRDALEAQLDRTRAALARRAVALYKAGALGPVPVLFAPGSLRERLGRLQALRRLVDHDERLVARFDAEREALAEAVREAEQALARRDAARERADARLAELERERAQRRTLLVQVRQDRARERAMLNELEAAARELERTLDELGDRPTPAPGPEPFAARRGRLEAPVAGAVLRRFGRVVDAEYRTETFRKGVDFAVERGEPVYAVADGTVRYAGWFRGYGRMVILDHGDAYFTVSGHLDEIEVAVGDRVRAGDRIGAAGDTGSLSGPRLYFEIRQGSEALDPAEWLRLLPGR